MMRGVLAQLGSGKQTEDAIIAQTTKKIEGMKQKAEKKRVASAKKAANKLKQAELARKRKAAIHRPEELLEQLASPDEGTQLLAAKNVAAASLKLHGKQQREFQDAMVPGLDALVTPPRDAVNYRDGGYIRRLPDDPWGNPYLYAYPGENGMFDIYSLGRDGREGGQDLDSDIGNWQG